jgi:arylformamidase
MIKGRFVDLSHRLIPGQEEYPLRLVTHRTADLYPQYPVGEGVWYIMQDIEMSSHCGTHIEFPYHHCRDGMDAAQFPFERLVHEAVLLDFKHKAAGDAVTVEELRLLSQKIRPGDGVLFNFNCARLYRTEHAHERPYLTQDAVRWLAQEKQVNLVGSDASGIELKGAPNQPNHQLLMEHGIPIIEFAANLEQIKKERFTLLVLALAVVGLDSCPVRLVAVEEE